MVIRNYLLTLSTRTAFMLIIISGQQQAKGEASRRTKIRSSKFDMCFGGVKVNNRTIYFILVKENGELEGQQIEGKGSCYKIQEGRSIGAESFRKTTTIVGDVLQLQYTTWSTLSHHSR